MAHPTMTEDKDGNRDEGIIYHNTFKNVEELLKESGKKLEVSRKNKISTFYTIVDIPGEKKP